MARFRIAQLVFATFIIPGTILGETEINIENKKQVFEVWGTNLNSLSANLNHTLQSGMVSGKLTAEEADALREKIAIQLFDQDQGIGFNGVRLFARTGQSRALLYSNFPTLHPAWFRFGEPWMRPNGEMRPDSDYDPVQMYLARAALERGANRFELRAQGAIHWMTRNGSAGGNILPDGTAVPNLSVARYDEYTDYLAKVVSRLTLLGFPVEAVSPIEEASSPPKDMIANPTDYLPSEYEGVNLQAKLFSRLRNSLNRAGHPEVKVSGPNEGSPFGTIKALENYSADDWEKIDIIGTHGYQADVGWSDEDQSRLIRLRNMGEAHGKEVQVTEDDNGRSYRGGDLTLDWATAHRISFKIFQYIKVLGIKKWTLWNPGPRLVWIDNQNKLSFRNQFHILKFLVKNFPAGTQVLEVDNASILAGIVDTPAGKRLKILVLNRSESGSENHVIFLPHLKSERRVETATLDETAATLGHGIPRHSVGNTVDKRILVSVPPLGVTVLTVVLGGL